MKKLNLLFLIFGIACMIFSSLGVMALLMLDNINPVRINDVVLGVMMVFGIGIFFILIAKLINRN